jgi:hypothetical protein
MSARRTPICQRAMGPQKSVWAQLHHSSTWESQRAGKTERIDLASAAAASTDIYPASAQRVRDMDWEMGGNSPAICGARASP